jgi:hypothetical protein
MGSVSMPAPEMLLIVSTTEPENVMLFSPSDELVWKNKISKVTALVYLLCKANMQRTFENVMLFSTSDELK